MTLTLSGIYIKYFTFGKRNYPIIQKVKTAALEKYSVQETCAFNSRECQPGTAWHKKNKEAEDAVPGESACLACTRPGLQHSKAVKPEKLH